MTYQQDNGPPLFTYAVLAGYVATFAAEWNGSGGLFYMYAFPWRLGAGETWRLVTSTFLHGSVLHLAFNASLFFRFMVIIENWLGPWLALVIYAFLAAGSAAAQELLGASPRGAIGASGVVYGLFGFLWVMRRRRDDAAAAVPSGVVQTMLAWLVSCYLLTAVGLISIANTAHVSGLLLGWLLGQAVVARRQWRLPIFAATVLLGAFLTAATWVPVWQRSFGRVPVVRGRYGPLQLQEDLKLRIEHPEPEELRPGILQ